MQECGEAMGQFVVTGGEATKLLQPIEESLDEVSGLVAMPVDVALREPMASGRNDGLSARGFDGRDQRIAVVSLVGNNRSGWDGCHEGRALRDIGDLAAGEDQSNRITQCIDRRMDLCGQPTPRSADRLIATVFFGAPAACWWARTTVESMNNSSKSASPLSASATRCQTPYISQRANRTYTECQLPNSAGKSRQGLPTRAVYRTASTNCRLSASRPLCLSACPATESQFATIAHRSTFVDPSLTSKFQNVNTNRLL